MTLTLAFRHDIGWNFRALIALVTGRPVHVALLFDDMGIEADGGAVRWVSREDRLRVGTWTLVTTPLDDAAVQRAYTFAVAQIGKPYDWRGVFLAWRTTALGNAVNGKWFCSELAAAALIAAGVTLPHMRPAHWTPRRLFDWCATWRRE